MVADIGDPTEGTVKVEGGTVPETWRDRTMVKARDLVANKVVTLVGNMEIKVEAEVRKGETVTKPTPYHQDRHKIQGRGKNCQEGGRLA